MSANGELPQIDCVNGKARTVGFGFTVIVIVLMVVSHPFAEAIIVKVVVCTTLVILVNIPLIEAVLSKAAMPVRFVVLVLDQLKVVPVTVFGLVMMIGVIPFSEQIV